ncbi:MAG: SDR family NAD(P)-dependent oxidoreductase [Pseudomonadota bacterium]
MRNLAGKRYWLVGASEGLGRAVAEELSKRGAEVLLSARNAERLSDLAAGLPGEAAIVPLDVADAASVKAAADELGDIDGVVFLAGLYWPMKASEWDAEQAETMADVNFTGALRVLSAVVPAFVARDRGHIVLTGSLSGFRGLPGAVGYGASKAAVMSLAETLRADLWRSGVVVQLVNPGFIRTRLTDKNTFEMPFIMDPDDAAKIFVGHMERGGFVRNFPRAFSFVFRWSRFLPDWLYFRIFA